MSSNDTKTTRPFQIYGSAWYSTAQQALHTALTIGHDEFILSAQEWEEIARIANRMLHLHAADLKPEEIEALARSVLTIDPVRHLPPPTGPNPN